MNLRLCQHNFFTPLFQCTGVLMDILCLYELPCLPCTSSTSKDVQYKLGNASNTCKLSPTCNTPTSALPHCYHLKQDRPGANYISEIEALLTFIYVLLLSMYLCYFILSFVWNPNP